MPTLTALLSASMILSTLPCNMQAQDLPGDGPQYTSDGNLMLPTGFETWVFVGSNLGLSYKHDLAATTAREAARADPQQFHNVYIARSAYSHFLANGSFPDRTILVMEVFAANGAEPKNILSNGVFNGPRTGVEIAVKNLHRPDGKTTPWAYYDFTDPSDPTKTRPVANAFPDEACESCHRAHANLDNVWVQFYPTLRDRK
ncbi:cytochrome P460 family protein [Bradyrhizobium sp. WSM 1704]|uniref:cytochrome P460 family protein n=1 Tax=Bradyrhizobium semiaridum TaxID=2821404 RepID=UPI001CE2B5A3|nr:cytochrome P460 family protein [Bradyrhizobium semiaridum]MCA6120457.1 cytochrome P460 family protein [Bradyrhizobium semiaridum]